MASSPQPLPRSLSIRNLYRETPHFHVVRIIQRSLDCELPASNARSPGTQLAVPSKLPLFVVTAWQSSIRLPTAFPASTRLTLAYCCQRCYYDGVQGCRLVVSRRDTYSNSPSSRTPGPLSGFAAGACSPRRPLGSLLLTTTTYTLTLAAIFSPTFYKARPPSCCSLCCLVRRSPCPCPRCSSGHASSVVSDLRSSAACPLRTQPQAGRYGLCYISARDRAPRISLSRDTAYSAPH